MQSDEDSATVALRRASFGEKERESVRYRGLGASIFRYDTGVEAIRLTNTRGSVVVLPYLGQIVWSATFDGVELAMQSMFRAPRPAKVIVETYGCLAYHAGLLRNGVPSPADNHALHGEMRFPGHGPVRTAYLALLISHVLLSVVALPMVLITFFFSLSGRFPQHRKIARYTYPIWLYVSVTGVVVYAMLAAWR